MATDEPPAITGNGDANGPPETTPKPLISVIIPVLNEAAHLPRTLAPLTHLPDLEVIVVDGGSHDNTPAIAQALKARVIASKPGRSHQMNQGAQVATGSILLFLHADTQLPPQFDVLVRQTLGQPQVVAGAFGLKINGGAWGLRLVEWGVAVRSRWGQLPYGDQALFLKATVFEAIGGFPELPIMEDFELIRQLRRQGRIAIAPATVLTSDRRWHTMGICRTTLINQVIIVGYLLGVSPTQLAGWYHQQRKRP